MPRSCGLVFSYAGSRHKLLMKHVAPTGAEETVQDICIQDQLTSTDNSVATSHLHMDTTPLSSSAPKFAATKNAPSSFKPSLPVKKHMNPPTTPAISMVGRGGEMGVVTGQETMVASATTGAGGISDIEKEIQEGNNFPLSSPTSSTSQSISQALHSLQDSGILVSSSMNTGLPIQLQGPIQHRSSLASRRNKFPPNPHYHHHQERDGFGIDNLMSSEDSNLQQDQTLAMQLPGSSENMDSSKSPAESALARSLSYPNLSNVSNSGDPSSRTILQPGEVQSSKGVHPQAPFLTHSFPANIGGFALSSMFAPHLQQQPLASAINPSSVDSRSGIMQTLGASLGSSNRSSVSVPIASNPSLVSSPVSNLLGGGGLNPSLSVINPPVSFNTGVGGGGGRVNNHPPSANLSMPLDHPIPGNQSRLPVISGMPAVYSYPYTTSLPTQSTSMVRMNPPGPAGFPPTGQTLVPGGYHQYIPQSPYGNSQHIEDR